jgi:hypothetical protein
MAYDNGKYNDKMYDRKMKDTKMYDKKSGYGGKFMDNGKGMCSYKDNPMVDAARVKPMCGPGMNPMQNKANKLLQKAHYERDSLRGKAGM